MKRLTHAVMLLLGLSMVIMASCTKDPDNGGNNGGGNNGNTYNGHEYVDLGLPSGTLWATCNVGATTPEGWGDLFAWGETTPKLSYTEDNYKYSIFVGPVDDWSYYKFTKYCCMPESGYNGFTDNLRTLEAMDDAAIVNWGNGWHTPSKEDFVELLRFTTCQVSSQNNVVGWTFIGINHNSIFLPKITAIDPQYGWDYSGGCWMNALSDRDSFSGRAFNGLNEDSSISRHLGLPVRPVCSR